MSWFVVGKPDVGFTLNGVLAGLVAITAGADVIGFGGSIIVGAIGGVLMTLSVIGFERIKIDDPVGAISVHGTCGLWGLLAVILTNPEAKPHIQLLGLVSIFVWVFGVSFLVWFLLNQVLGLRVGEEEEVGGLDVVDCGIEAYPEFTKGG